MKLITLIKRIAEKPCWLVWIYLFWVTLAELLIVKRNFYFGALLHTILFIYLLLHFSFGEDTAEQRYSGALILVPLIRLFSLSMPIVRLPQYIWFPIVYLPLIGSTWMVIRHLQLSGKALALQPGNFPQQLAIAGIGFSIGVVQFRILRPIVLNGSSSWMAACLLIISLILFTGFTEELIFRGLIQSLILPVLGRWGLFYVSLLYAATNIVQLSWVNVILVFGVGLLFSYCARWSRSLWGISLAHGLSNITLLLIMPYLTNLAAKKNLPMIPWLTWSAIAYAIFMIGIMLYANLKQPYTARRKLSQKKESQHSMIQADPPFNQVGPLLVTVNSHMTTEMEIPKIPDTGNRFDAAPVHSELDDEVNLQVLIPRQPANARRIAQIRVYTLEPILSEHQDLDTLLEHRSSAIQEHPAVNFDQWSIEPYEPFQEDSLPNNFQTWNMQVNQLTSLNGQLKLVVKESAYGNYPFLYVITLMKNTFALVRLCRNNVLYEKPEPRQAGKKGAPKKHGDKFRLSSPSRLADQNGAFTVGLKIVKIYAWQGLHLKRLPGLSATILRVEFLSPDGQHHGRQPIWLLWSGPATIPLQDLFKLYYEIS